MLVGCLLRHYKVYENVVFIPVSSGVDGSLAVFTGNNGVGKSSVLEAVNSFFYQKNWNVNSKAKKMKPILLHYFSLRRPSSNLPWKIKL